MHRFGMSTTFAALLALAALVTFAPVARAQGAMDCPLQLQVPKELLPEVGTAK